MALPGDAMSSSYYVKSIHQRTTTPTGPNPNISLEYKDIKNKNLFYIQHKFNTNSKQFHTPNQI